MPLSTPHSRQSIHTRTITINGYHRDDGLWDIEGRLIDIKGYDLEGLWGDAKPVKAVKVAKAAKPAAKKAAKTTGTTRKKK